MGNIEQALLEKVKAAIEQGTPLDIFAGATKSFLGREGQGEPFGVAGHCGIVDYDPSELVLTARTGTTLAEIEVALADSGQMLPFEPPAFGETATLGGTIACGLSGPRRPYAGAARDSVLGTKIINGRGEILNFGGRVMKNVAGFDCSRLMTGAFGTLGILLEISLKVLPRPAASLTLVRACSEADAVSRMSGLFSKALPVDAAAYVDGCMHVRLSGSVEAVEHVHLDGDRLMDAESFWRDLREQQLPFFKAPRPLWRIVVKPSTLPLQLPGEWLYDWGGAQRWLTSDADAATIRRVAEAAGGYATLFRGRGAEPFHGLQSPLFSLHKSLKASFDPHGIFNPGRLYEGL